MLDLSHIESFYPEALRPMKRSLLREYLQLKILEQIFGSPWAGKLVFMGGTAIHLVHGNTRFSEDLDFDNQGIDAEEFREMGDLIVRAFKLQGYNVDSTIVVKSAFHCFLRFPGLLFEAGISRHRDEVLTIQIDAEPQNFSYTPEKVLLNKFDVFVRIAVVPAAVLTAQKITCLFTRKRPMGRDAFDIVFLLGKTRPDMDYLLAKLGIKDKKQLRDRLFARCKEIDFKKSALDVEPFLFAAGDAKKVELFEDVVKTFF
jgi:predicted nucleotidyltransferase component of viral defense system